jgi:PAS domain S-box-containing protein
MTHARDFEKGQLALLEKIACGAPLAELLEDVVRLIEAQGGGMLCSILLVDFPHGVVRPVAAPSLPADYTRALDGLSIGPAEGSCGAAASRAERVIAEDIATHPYWAKYKDIALPYGLRACWSSPIFDPQKNVLGTFAMYYREPRAPTAEEIAWVDFATHVASVAIVRDRAEQSLRRSAFVYQNISDCIFYLAVEAPDRYRFISINPAFVEATGLRESDIVGKTTKEVIPEPSHTLVLEKYLRSIETRKPVCWDEVTPYPTGEKHGAITVAPIFDAAGHCTHLLGTVHDVTARTEAERERRKLEAQLFQVQRMQALGALASGIAHDFNNVLATIRALTTLALKEEVVPEVRQSLTDIAAAEASAAGLVRQILAFGRKNEPKREPVSLATNVDAALGLLRATVLRGVDVRTQFDDDASPILADPTQIQQLVINLATNAAHAMEGRVGRAGVLEVKIDHVRADDALHARVPELAPGEYVRLAVRDEGHGMDAQTLARAFEPFFTTKAEGTGTGLGLSVVRGIMKNHGGAVHVESEVGKGSTFSLYFPAA